MTTALWFASIVVAVLTVMLVIVSIIEHYQNEHHQDPDKNK